MCWKIVFEGSNNNNNNSSKLVYLTTVITVIIIIISIIPIDTIVSKVFAQSSTTDENTTSAHQTPYQYSHCHTRMEVLLL